MYSGSGYPGIQPEQREGRMLEQGPGWRVVSRPEVEAHVDAQSVAPATRDDLEQLAPDVLGRERERHLSCARAVEVLARPIEVEPRGYVGRVAVESRGHDAARRCSEVGRCSLRERSAIDREGERPPELDIAELSVRVVEPDVRQPRQRLVSADLTVHVVGRVRRIDDASEVELASTEGGVRVVYRRACALDLRDVAAAEPAIPLVADEHQPLRRVLRDAQRPAHDLVLRSRPRLGVLLDRVPGLRRRIRTVHDAHEVRRRSDEPELDRPVVERSHTDAPRVARPAERVVLPVLEHEVDGDGGAGTLGIENALDPELDVVSRQRRPVRPGEALAEVEDVAEPVVGDLPALRERWDDRPLRPRLDEPVEELHAELDVRPRSPRGFGIGSPAGRKLAAIRSVSLAGPGAASGGVQCSKARSVGLVRLGEAERRVEGERELEEDERDLLPLAAALEQRQQVAVVLDRLVERVLLPCLVAGAQQVPGRLVLVLRPQPVMSEQAEHLGVAPRVPLLEPLCRAPMQAGPLAR